MIKQAFNADSYSIWSDDLSKITIGGIVYRISNISGGEVRLTGKDYNLDQTSAFSKIAYTIIAKNNGILQPRTFTVGAQTFTEDADGVVWAQVRTESGDLFEVPDNEWESEYGAKGELEIMAAYDRSFVSNLRTTMIAA